MEFNLSARSFNQLTATNTEPCSVAHATRGCRVVCVGTTHLIRLLPPSLLQKAVKAGEQFSLHQAATPINRLTFIELLAILFDSCRNVFGSDLQGETLILRSDAGDFSLIAYGRVQVKPKYRDGRLDHIVVRIADDLAHYTNYASSQWQEIRDQVNQIMFKRNKNLGEPEPIISAALSVLHNCPYVGNERHNYSHKWRASLIAMVCEKEDARTVIDFKQELWRRPQMLKVIGWCGGNVLHPCSRLGNIRQVESVLNALGDRDFLARFRAPPQEVIMRRNHDGYTPRIVAEIFGQEKIAAHLRARESTMGALR